MERARVAIFGLLLVFAVAFSPVEGGAKKAMETCMQQTGATKADVEHFMHTGEASQPLKCMFSCTLQAIKFMKADGTLDTDTMKSMMPSFTAGLIDQCTSKAQDGDVCQRAYTYLGCFVKAEPKIFMEFTST